MLKTSIPVKEAITINFLIITYGDCIHSRWKKTIIKKATVSCLSEKNSK